MKCEEALSLLAALVCPVALATVTSENPDGYVPAMLSNGRICLTANQFGGVTRAKPKCRYGELTDGDGELRLAQGVPDDWRDYSFRLPAENGITVDLAVRDGKLSRLELHARSAVPGRKVKVVLPPSLGASPVEIEPICP